MVRRNYDIETDFRKKDQVPDSSYKSCLCSMLVFFAICIIILLASLPWKKIVSKETEVEPRSAEKTYRNYESLFEKIIEKTTRRIETTTKIHSTDHTESVKVSLDYYVTEKPTESILLNHSETERSTEKLKLVESKEDPTPVTEEDTFSSPKTENTATDTPDKTTEKTDRYSDIKVKVRFDEEIYVTPPMTTESSTIDDADHDIFLSSSPNSREVSSREEISTFTDLIEDEITITSTFEPEIFDKDSTYSATTDITIADRFLPTHSTTSSFTSIENSTDYFEPISSGSSTFSDFTSTTTSSSKAIETSKIRTVISSTTPFTWFADKSVNKTCISASCRNKAASILGQMEPGTNPCDNFYDFACGSKSISRKTRRKQQVTERIVRNIRKSSTSDSERKYQQFYESCVTFDPLKVNFTNLFLHSTLAIDDFYDGFYTIPNKEDHLAELLARLLKYNSAPFFDIDLEVDPKTKKSIFKMIPSKNLMISEIELSKSDFKAKCEIDANFVLKEKPKNLNSVYNNYVECLRNKTKYINDVRRALKAFDIFAHLDDYNKTQHIQSILFNLELTLFPVFKIFPNQKDLQFAVENSQFTPLRIEEMKKKYSILNWQILFEKLVGKNVSDSHLVHIYFPSVFEDLFDELSTLKPRDVHNIALAMYVHDLYKEFAVPFHSFPRDTYCLEIMKKFLPNITSEIYLKSWTKEQLRRIETDTLRIFSQLQTVFRTSISTQKMLTNEDQEALLSKLNSLQLEFYFSEKMVGGSKALNGVVIEKKNFFKNFIQILQRHRLNKYRMWNKNATIPENLWSHILTPYSIEPVSVYSHNLIAVPYGMFLLEDLEAQPRYVTMSTIGFQLAQQISLVIGQKFNLSPISENARELYDTEIKACLNKIYDTEKNIEIKGTEIPYFENVTLSLNRHIIDGSAIKLAYDTFRDEAKGSQNLPWIEESFSHQQLFYISAVQEMCDESQDDLIVFMKQLLDGLMLPERLRVDSFLGNDEMFSTIFECIPGSNLNPPIKCKQFPNISPASIVYDDDYGAFTSS